MEHESGILTYSNSESLEARSQLFELLKNYPATDVETERSLGLFLRASLLARIFAIKELYEQIIPLPGVIIDLGTWRGQTAVLCENLRAILEPLNFNRRIVCFDTFEGYAGFSSTDKTTEYQKNGSYSTGQDYAQILSSLLVLHEKNNAMGHNFGKHQVIVGDCREKVPLFFKDAPNEVVSLAFFDVNAFEPTKQAFEIIFERLVPGGLVAFWQLTRPSIHGEGRVYAENILNYKVHNIFRSKFYPGLCYLKKG